MSRRVAPGWYLFNGFRGGIHVLLVSGGHFFLVKNRFLGPKFHVIGGRKNTHTHTHLGGGFKYFLFSPRTLGKMNPI